MNKPQTCNSTAPSIFTGQVAELVAIGAAIAVNCEPCFKYHYDQARKLGISDLDMRYAVDLAQKVKDTPARHVKSCWPLSWPGNAGYKSSGRFVLRKQSMKSQGKCRRIENECF